MAAAVESEGFEHAAALLDVCRSSLLHFQSLHCDYGLGEGFVRAQHQAYLPALSQCASLEHIPDARERCFRGVFEPLVEEAADMPGTMASSALYDAANPMYPCGAQEVVDSGAHGACWERHAQQTMNSSLYPFLKGDINRVALYCESLPPQDGSVCAMGLAGQIQFGAGTDTGNISTLCAQSIHQGQCVRNATADAYYFDDGMSAPQTFLSACLKSDTAESCYTSFSRTIGNRFSGETERVSACNAFDDGAFKSVCTQWAAKQ